nr:hypothetical protein [Tanacetum cinerariifolium]
NDTIEDNADVNPSTNVYLDVNQNTSIKEVVEDLSSLDRSSDKAERLAHLNNGLDDLDISLHNRLLHQDKCLVRPVKAAVNDSSIVSPSTPQGGKEQPVSPEGKEQPVSLGGKEQLVSSEASLLRAEGDALISKGPAAESHS